MTAETTLTLESPLSGARGAATVHGLFEAQAERAPDAVACSMGGWSLTYGELDRRANQLAHHLRALGVGPDVCVAVHLERSPETVMAILGVLKAGGAYVPLDPEHPADRRHFMIEDSRAVALVSRRPLWAEQPPGVAFVCLDDESLADGSEGRLPALNGADDLAYVIYTSGSTGVPKGCMVTHHNVVRLLTSTEHWFGFGPDDVVTLFHSFAFDVSVFEMWSALFYGGRLVVVPFATSRTPEAMARLLDEEGVTVLRQTPSAFRQIAPAVLAAGVSPPLRYVIFAGEPLDFRILRPWFERFGDERPRMVNMYGITETTVDATYRVVSAHEAFSETPSCIGVPIPDLELLVWNDRFEPVGEGEVGEIFVAGAGVARGYLNRPELNAERFLERNGRRLYRSGDLARPLPGGDLEYLGRADTQVKVRGFRIETGEVEARLLESPDLVDVAVRAVGDGEQARLVAWCVPRAAQSIDRPALRRRLGRTLPDYMIPAAFVSLERLPLTVNGKLDARALLVPEADAAPYRAPEGDTEALLARLWVEALGGDLEVGRDDNFVALGGQSIDAARVLRRIRTEWSVALSFRDFFNAPTLADLAAEVDARLVGRAEASVASRPTGSPTVLSFAEEQFSLLTRLAPGLPLYSESLVIAVAAPLDVARLERAFVALTVRHTVLRSRFVDDEGVARRVVDPTASVPFAFHDLAAAEDPDAEFQRRATARVREGYDLAKGPLFRVDVYRLDEERYRILVSFHHAILDGAACVAVVRDLAALYGGGSLPPVGIDIDDLAAWQRGRLDEVKARHLAWWQERLSGLEPRDLPTDRSRPQVRSFAGARFRRRLPRELLDRLRLLARESGATLYIVLLAAFEVLLERHSGGGEVVLGTISGGRERPESEATVGSLVNALVLRQAVPPGQPFRELLADARQTFLEAHSHGEIPFATLVRELEAGGDPGRNPLFQVAFSANVPIPDPLRGWSVQVSPFDTGTARFDLAVQVDGRGGDVDLYFEYATDLFEAVSVERLADRYLTLLSAVAEDPFQPVGGLPLLDEAEIATLEAWGDGGPASRGAPVLERIHRHALATPTATAAVHGDQSLTYWELDRRSDDVAERLVEMGVGREVIVGLGTRPSLEWLVGMLGILKASAAFLPLDPTHPPARLAEMLEDARVPVLCTVPESASTFASFPGRVLDLTTCHCAMAQRRNPPLHRQSLAYVIYTSGSTGRPKGAMVEHGGLDNMIEAHIRLTGLTAADRVAQFASPSFDASIFEALPALSAGATLVIVPPEARLADASTAEFLARNRVTVMWWTPMALAAVPPIELPELRIIMAAGEALPAEVVDRWAPSRTFYNLYGPTEATIWATTADCHPRGGKPPIGRPILGARVHVVDEQLRRCPIGVPGELLIGGAGVGRGYLRRDDLTAERFLQDPFARDGGLVYRTGDLVRFRADGQLEFLGRMDRQVKLRGFRIELGEVESALLRHPAVAQAIAVVREDRPGKARLVAYVVGRDGPVEAEVLRCFLAESLPAFMVPSAFVTLPGIPVSRNGKVDHKALPAPATSERGGGGEPPASDVESAVAAVWCEVLGVEAVGTQEPFFEAGGDSLSLAQVQALLHRRLAVEVDMTTLLRLPTVSALAAHLRTLRPLEPVAPGSAPDEHVSPRPGREPAGAIAVIGMALRGPGVDSVDDLWSLLMEGRDAITWFSVSGDRPPNYVPAEGVLQDALGFDAGFFGITATDAALMDPQHRVFLEAAWSALEDAGCDPRRYPGRIGVFGGAGMPRYWLGPLSEALRTDPSGALGQRAEIYNGAEFLTTRTASKLGLSGPVLTVQTACSTSGAAVHLARQALLAGECEMAIAGGVSLASITPEEWGYLAVDGGILSPTGRCRPFSVDADGTVSSSGVALVVLKRLADARRDGDTVRAVLLGSAMNNDGGTAIGFTAPSEEGQVAVLEASYAAAGVDPNSVAFVEAHGTGTALGDAVEVAALTRVFGPPRQGHRISLTSLKANLGHLDAAAGAAGLVKAVLCLEHHAVPGLPGFSGENPRLRLSESPFVVHGELHPLPHGSGPLRAGVSSFGMGGTNVHLVLEEAPPSREPESPARSVELICLSAHTPSALERAAEQIGGRLRGASPVEVADAAYTLAQGRTELSHRRAMVVRRGEEAGAALADATRWQSGEPSMLRPVAFLFPGQGAQVVGMGRALYREHPVFRAEVDAALEVLRTRAGLDLAPHLLDADPSRQGALNEAGLAQPATFVTSYALARLLMSWGLTPTALLGHSLGEYTAAALAGVFSLEDALGLVRDRGLLMESAGPGAMASVLAARNDVERHLGPDVAVATEAPGATVISGPSAAIAAAEVELAGRGFESTRLPLTQAYHSPMMHSIRDAFAKRVAQVPLFPPAIPVLSCVTGDWLGAGQATDPVYWANHLCNTVTLTDGLGALLGDRARAILDVGPGRSMAGFLRRHPQATADLVAASVLPRPGEESEPELLLESLGRLWINGVRVDWDSFYAGERRRRTPLPTYPFERKTYTITKPDSAPRAPAAETPTRRPFRLPDEVEAIEAQAQALGRRLAVRGLDERPGVQQGLDALGAALVHRYFAERAGVRPGEAHAEAELRARLRILPKFEAMFDHLLGVLERHGIVTRADGAVTWREDPSADVVKDAFLAEHHDFSGLVRFLEHCIAAYPEALSGEVESIGVLYPDGSDAFYLKCRAESEETSAENLCLELGRGVILDAVRRLGHPARLLEVGAGHGTFTWPLLGDLVGHDAEYHFTDIGRSFLVRAEEEATRRGMPWVHTGRLDLNRTPEAQGYAPGRFDLVVGFNAVHTATDIARTLTWLHDLLAPGGLLLLVEATRIEAWEYLTWGLAPGFWDVARPTSGSLAHSADEWQDLIGTAGFATAAAFPPGQDHAVILAQRDPGGTAPSAASVPRLAAIPRPSGPSDRRVEAEVARLWQRLLGVESIEPQASFFDLGGDSLLAVQLLAEIRVRLGVELKVSQFSQAPTLNGLLVLLAPHLPAEPAAPPEHRTEPSPAVAAPVARAEAPWADVPEALPACLVPLQTQGTRTPFFCVHGVGGAALSFAPLAARLDRPVYGLQATTDDAPASLATMAEGYVEAVRALQPAGPYLLGGWSFGVVVAHEMARQLEDAGEVVAALALIDPTRHHRVSRLALQARLARSAWQAAPKGGSGVLADTLRRTATMLEASAHFRALSERHLRLWTNHRPGLVRAPVIHFRASRQALPFEHSGPLTVIDLPGDHFSILNDDESLRLLANGLGAALEAGDDEAELLAVARLFFELSAQGPTGAEVVDALFAREGPVLLYDSYDSDVRGFDDIRLLFAEEFQAVGEPEIHMYDPFVRVAPGGQAAWVAAKIDASLTLRRTNRPIRFSRVRVTLAFEKHGGAWRVVHVHYSLPVGVPLRMME